ncbi:MAG TPA: hypothetical protein VK983_05490 [Candidatus Limnocylindrales bacterium]|nr:hypothetical protein [Candidatus Limnocylindrales bacterium]
MGESDSCRVETWPILNAIRLRRVAQTIGMDSLVEIGEPRLAESDLSNTSTIERCVDVEIGGTPEQQRHLELELVDDIAQEFGYTIKRS